MTCECKNFKIIRFRRDNDFNVISQRITKRNLTEKEAKEHCSREDWNDEIQKCDNCNVFKYDEEARMFVHFLGFDDEDFMKSNNKGEE